MKVEEEAARVGAGSLNSWEEKMIPGLKNGKRASKTIRKRGNV